MKDQHREWDTMAIREQVVSDLKNVKDIDSFFSILKKIENSFSSPWQVTYKQLVEINDEDKVKKE